MVGVLKRYERSEGDRSDGVEGGWIYSGSV
jgi:hypothetical protein